MEQCARLQGIAEAVATIRKERRGRDVYVLGAANVGKSAFVRFSLFSTMRRVRGYRLRAVLMPFSLASMALLGSRLKS